ncbi:MAG: hypothetical protein GEV12_08580 [Micromonosporaceae bacterium]|nr:hypothetical protein [Micromonosporaceae bacterium]
MSHDPTTHRRHLAGDHTRCRPGWCLAARAGQLARELNDTLDQLHQPAETVTCAVCAGPIEWAQHPDRDQAGWRHLTAEPGPAHGAYPAGGPLRVHEITDMCAGLGCGCGPAVTR